MPQVDVLAALITYLKAQGAIATAVSTRVYGGQLPASQSGQRPAKSIVLSPGGSGFDPFARTYVPMETLWVQAACYGPTQNDAWGVYLALNPIMHAMPRTIVGSVLLYSSVKGSGAFLTQEPETDWPVVRASYSVMSSMEAVAS